MDAKPLFALAIFVTLTAATALAQNASQQAGVAVPPNAPSDGMEQQPEAPQQSLHDDSLKGKQTKRILGIVPNFRSVSADEKLPSQSIKEKFVETTQDSFDYSSFVFVGILAGVSQLENSTPEFHQGAAGYGRYYWHTFVDQADENYQVEFFFPVALRQDPRYYTLGHGGILKRTAYSFSRVLITRADAGGETFNSSEIVGAGAASGISDLYYPSVDRTWTKTGQRWLLNVSLDGGTFIFKEFWPDLNSSIFHQRQ